MIETSAVEIEIDVVAAPSVEITTDVITIELRPQTTIVELETAPGPRGPAGLDGDGRYQAVAVGPIGGGRVVRRVAAGVSYADPAAVGTIGPGLGVTEFAAVNLAFVAVRYHGLMTDPAWSWIPDQPIYLGPNGVLTQAIPSGHLVIVAKAIAVDAIFVDPEHPILLAS